MARAVTPARTKKPVAKATPARPVASAKRVPAKTASAPKLGPKLGKEELRAQVEKLERTNLTLRAKNKEAGQSAKAAAARVAELEIQVEQLEQKAASQKAPAKAAPQKAEPKKAEPKKVESKKAEPAKPVSAKPASAKAGKATPARSRRQKSEIDPGDAVPPGVAVENPQPMDEEARTAKENLEEHLSGD